MPRLHRVMMSALLLTTCLTVAAVAAPARPGCVLLADSTDDANQEPYVGTTPAPSSPAADIITLRAWRDATKFHVRAYMKAAPQPDLDSPGGYLYDVRASVDGQEYSISANTTVDGQSYSMSKVTPPNSPPSNVDGSPITGAFSPLDYSVQVDVPLSRLQQATGVKAQSLRFTDVRMFTMRAVGTELLGRTYTGADFASSDTTFTVKTGKCR